MNLIHPNDSFTNYVVKNIENNKNTGICRTKKYKNSWSSFGNQATPSHIHTNKCSCQKTIIVTINKAW